MDHSLKMRYRETCRSQIKTGRGREAESLKKKDRTVKVLMVTQVVKKKETEESERRTKKKENSLYPEFPTAPPEAQPLLQLMCYSGGGKEGRGGGRGA